MGQMTARNLLDTISYCYFSQFVATIGLLLRGKGPLFVKFIMKSCFYHCMCVTFGVKYTYNK
jgi:hypothetical protein